MNPATLTVAVHVQKNGSVVGHILPRKVRNMFFSFLVDGGICEVISMGQGQSYDIA